MPNRPDGSADRASGRDRKMGLFSRFVKYEGTHACGTLLALLVIDTASDGYRGISKTIMAPKMGLKSRKALFDRFETFQHGDRAPRPRREKSPTSRERSHVGLYSRLNFVREDRDPWAREESLFRPFRTAGRGARRVPTGSARRDSV
jgi:hypothetical protein